MKKKTKRRSRIIFSLITSISLGVLAAICLMASFDLLRDGSDAAGFAFVCSLYIAWDSLIWGFEVRRAKKDRHYVILSGLMMSSWALIFMLGVVYIPLNMPEAAALFFFLAFITLGIILGAWFGVVKYSGKQGAFHPVVPGRGGLPYQPYNAAEYHSMTGFYGSGMNRPVGPDVSILGSYGAGCFLPEMEKAGTLHWTAAACDVTVYAEPGVDPEYVKRCAEYLAGLSREFLTALAKRIYQELHVEEYEKLIGNREISENPFSLIVLSCPDRVNIFRPMGPEPAFTVGGDPIFQHDLGMAWCLRGREILRVGYRNEVEHISPWAENYMNSV